MVVRHIKGCSRRFIPVYRYRGKQYALCNHMHVTLEDAQVCLTTKGIEKDTWILELQERPVIQLVKSILYRPAGTQRKWPRHDHWSSCQDGASLTLEQIRNKVDAALATLPPVTCQAKKGAGHGNE